MCLCVCVCVCVCVCMWCVCVYVCACVCVCVLSSLAPQVSQSRREHRLHDLSGLVHTHDQELQQLCCCRRVEKAGRDGGLVLTQETTLQALE